MSSFDGNGWTKYEQLVLFRLDRIEARLDAMSLEVQELVAAKRLQHLRVATLSFAVAITTAFGGRAAWDILTKILF